MEATQLLRIMQQVLGQQWQLMEAIRQQVQILQQQQQQAQAQMQQQQRAPAATRSTTHSDSKNGESVSVSAVDHERGFDNVETLSVGEDQ